MIVRKVKVKFKATTRRFQVTAKERSLVQNQRMRIQTHNDSSPVPALRRDRKLVPPTQRATVAAAGFTVRSRPESTRILRKLVPLGSGRRLELLQSVPRTTSSVEAAQAIDARRALGCLAERACKKKKKDHTVPSNLICPRSAASAVLAQIVSSQGRMSRKLEIPLGSDRMLHQEQSEPLSRQPAQTFMAKPASCQKDDTGSRNLNELEHQGKRTTIMNAPGAGAMQPHEGGGALRVSGGGDEWRDRLAPAQPNSGKGSGGARVLGTRPGPWAINVMGALVKRATVYW
ncbi:hypothetical protein DFP72DRAFT_859917 [Ephemerocybe angulata]|uniref:Uncharacterized protein n=1 Tax=Ephemerocybe angulata TaxID=980116 RepID=A0A8H6HAY6_9AGAR|nr:hypothetical protein DFP72DRAFT_859917 [Tulosesus angulatus]